MLATHPTKLYSFWLSSCSFRVRIALNLKNVKYEYYAVNLSEDEQLDGSYRDALNPMKQVPTLEIDGTILTQSVPIIEYLEERNKAHGVRLMPDDQVSRNRVRQITEIINSGIQPLQSTSARNKLIAVRMEYEGMKLQQDKEAQSRYIEKWCRQSIEDGFDALETLLERTCGIYCVGNQVSMADCFLIPQVFNARNRFKVDVKKYENIYRIFVNCMHLKAFKDAHPMNQPDAPKRSKL